MIKFRHLEQHNETYSQHFCKSIKFAGNSALAALVFTIHAIWPDIFTTNGSALIASLNESLKSITK